MDMGHVLIGLNARVSSIARHDVPPLHASIGGWARTLGRYAGLRIGCRSNPGPTGLDIVTWVGDLGGAAARVALDRTKRTNAGVERYFRGTDYGAKSNLEGDVSAYVVATQPGSSAVQDPTIPPSGMIADALATFFLKRGREYQTRCRRFLMMQGGRFRGKTIKNKSVVEGNMATKICHFAAFYMTNYLRQRGRLKLKLLLAAMQHLAKASDDVSRRFMRWLLSCR
jgi:hypothetical protein